jgi:hypothetical protein
MSKLINSRRFIIGKCKSILSILATSYGKNNSLNFYNIQMQ